MDWDKLFDGSLYGRARYQGTGLFEMTIFKYFNPSIFYKAKKAKFSTKLATGYSVTRMWRAEISEYQEI